MTPSLIIERTHRYIDCSCLGEPADTDHTNRFCGWLSNFRLMTDDGRIERLRDRRAGDDVDVYDAAERSSLPEWWRRAVEEHEAFGLRPYRPPRFTDGTLTTPLVSELEAAHDIEIKLVGVDSAYGDDWSVHIDGEPAFDIARRRDPNGYTVFEQDSETFTERIETAVHSN